MDTTGIVWIFFNIKTQQKTKPMSQAKAQAFVLKLSKPEMRYLVAWTPGWDKWIPVKEIIKSEQNFFPLPPPVGGADHEETISGEEFSDSFTGSLGKIEKTYTTIQLDFSSPTPKDYQSDFRPESVNWEKTPVLPILKIDPSMQDKEDERREYKRFPHRIEIVIMTRKGKSFRSSSANISLGGAFLREPIPAAILREVMDLVIINPFPDEATPSHLLVKGRIVGDIKDRRRLMFYDVSPEVQQKLQYILEKYKKNYMAHKKKRAA